MQWIRSLSPDDRRLRLTRGLVLRVIGYASPYWSQLAGILVTVLLGAGLALLAPLIFRTLIDSVLPSKDIGRLAVLALVLLLIPVLSSLLTIIQRRLNAAVGEGVTYDLRVALFGRLQHMSLRFFTNTRVGELMSRLNNDVLGAQNAISNTLVNLLTNLVQAAAILAVMFSLAWRLALASLLIIPVFAVVARSIAGRLRLAAHRQMELYAQMYAHMNETLNIGGALLVKLFGRERSEEQRLRERAARVRDIGVERAVLGSSLLAVLGIVGAVGMALAYGIGGYYVINESMTVGTIVAFGAYLGALYGALQGLTSSPIEFITSLVSFERVFEVIDLPDDVPQKPDAIGLANVKGNLEFDRVTFRYALPEAGLLREVKRLGSPDEVVAVLSLASRETERRPSPPQSLQEHAEDDAQSDANPGPASQARIEALEDVSFVARQGQLVALVGPSGAGKTTLTYLIPRLYDPTAGAIRIDGHDVRDITLDSLAATIGMVTQETYLFHDTIRTNLTYARLEASQAEIEAAARAANIDRFISDLPDGYDTVVGERGYRLSGGEKQRIALARVILKDPRILILDEATSSLDSESEALIQEALKRVLAGRTSIVIAHRLSTILAADLILVLDRGRIVERGTHTELLALGGLYSQLYRTQFMRAGASA